MVTPHRTNPSYPSYPSNPWLKNKERKRALYAGCPCRAPDVWDAHTQGDASLCPGLCACYPFRVLAWQYNERTGVFLFFVLHPLYVQDLILGVVGLEFGDYLFHLLHDGHLIKGFGDSVELSLVLESLFIGILRHLSNHDVGMGSGNGVLLAGQQLLIKFLAITKTGIENLDVLSPREIYHPLGKVGNAHRLTHIENVYLAPVSHGAGLENQSASFGDEHEIAYDVGVGDGDRTSLANLFLEDGNDRAVGAQNVTKSGGDKLSYRQTTVKLTEFVGFKWFKRFNRFAWFKRFNRFAWFKRFNRFAWFKSYWYLVPLNSESLIVLMKLAIAIDSFLQSAYI